MSKGSSSIILWLKGVVFMEFDRTRIKEEAKARMRQTRPRPWQVSLAYVFFFFLSF